MTTNTHRYYSEKTQSLMLIIVTDLDPSVAVRIFFPITPENGDNIYEWKISIETQKIIKTLTIR